MKLTLILENDLGVKIERNMIINEAQPDFHTDVIVEDMVSVLKMNDKPL